MTQPLKGVIHHLTESCAQVASASASEEMTAQATDINKWVQDLVHLVEGTRSAAGPESVEGAWSKTAGFSGPKPPPLGPVRRKTVSVQGGKEKPEAIIPLDEKESFRDF